MSGQKIILRFYKAVYLHDFLKFTYEHVSIMTNSNSVDIRTKTDITLSPQPL